MSQYVTDTHALIWHLQDSQNLSPLVRSLFSQADSGQTTIFIPAIVLVEMTYLAEKGRIPMNLVTSLLRLLQSGGQNYQLTPLNIPIIENFPLIPRTLVPDMPDRIIAVTALTLKLPLLSRDAAITQVSLLQVVW